MNNMYDILAKMDLLEGKGTKPDFLDIDQDGDRREPMKQAARQAKEVDEGSTGDYSAKKARAGKDIGKPGKQFAKIAADAAKRYGSKERGEKVAGAVLAKLRKEGIEEARHPQELDYQEGPEDDEEYRRHHGLDDPDRKRERKLRATDYKTLDRLERQAVDRAKQIDEADMEEGNDFTKARMDAIRAGKPTFKLGGKTYRVTGDTTDEKQMEGRNDASPLDDPLTRFRKRHAPSVMKDPKGREELSKLDTEYGERKKTGYGRGEEEDEDDEDNGKKKIKPAGEKRGRGRPKGSKRAIGAKGPTGRSKLLTREQGVAEDYDQDEYDEEGEMAKSQARTIEDAAQELQDILDDDENLPEWVQKKITLAKEYIDSARDYMKANPDEEDMDVDVEVDDEEFMAEKAVSRAQRAAAGIAHAARKGDIPKSELRGASKEMAKMPAGELRKFAKTKEKGLPEKVKEEDKDKEEVDETTVAGSVAVSTDTPKGKKSGMQFGKGVYESQIAESFDRKLNMLTEGMNINMSMDENGRKSLSVSATDDDAMKLAQILKLAGMESAGSYQEACPSCGDMHEGRCRMEEDLANSPDPEYAELGDTRDYGVSGGLNGPKLQSNPNNMADNPLAMRNLGSRGASGQLNLGAMAEDVEQRLENRLMDLYKRIS